MMHPVLWMILGFVVGDILVFGAVLWRTGFGTEESESGRYMLSTKSPEQVVQMLESVGMKEDVKDELLQEEA